MLAFSRPPFALSRTPQWTGARCSERQDHRRLFANDDDARFAQRIWRFGIGCRVRNEKVAALVGEMSLDEWTGFEVLLIERDGARVEGTRIGVIRMENAERRRCGNAEREEGDVLDVQVGQPVSNRLGNVDSQNEA